MEWISDANLHKQMVILLVFDIKLVILSDFLVEITTQ